MQVMEYVAVDFYINLYFSITNLISFDQYDFHGWRVVTTSLIM